MSRTLLHAAPHDKVADEDLHGFTVLVPRLQERKPTGATATEVSIKVLSAWDCAGFCLDILRREGEGFTAWGPRVEPG